MPGEASPAADSDPGSPCPGDGTGHLPLCEAVLLRVSPMCWCVLKGGMGYSRGSALLCDLCMD